MMIHDHLPHQRLSSTLGALAVAAACFLGLGALAAAIAGCAVVAGAAAGGAAGYVAGHEAGEHEAEEGIREHEAATRPHED